MGADYYRNKQYRKALEGAVRGKHILDIGTGRDAVLAKICVQAGAIRVTAIEVVPKAAEKARDSIEREGMKDKIDVIEGYSIGLELPKVDIVISEIVGTLALEEGMSRVMHDLQQRKDVVDSSKPGWSIPRYVETRVAPVTIFEGMGKLSHNVDRHGGRFPIKGTYKVQNPPPQDALLGELRRMDSLHTDKDIQLKENVTITWRFDKIEPGTLLVGFACAPWISLDDIHAVDGWGERTNWGHKLIAFKYPAKLQPGDAISFRYL